MMGVGWEISDGRIARSLSVKPTKSTKPTGHSHPLLCIDCVPAKGPRPRRGGPACRRPGSGGRTPPPGRERPSVCVSVCVCRHTREWFVKSTEHTLHSPFIPLPHPHPHHARTSASRAAISRRFPSRSTRPSASSFDSTPAPSPSSKGSASCAASALRPRRSAGEGGAEPSSTGRSSSWIRSAKLEFYRGGDDDTLISATPDMTRLHSTSTNT